MTFVWSRRSRRVRKELAGREDASGMGLRGVSLVDMDLTGKSFRKTNLEGADLTGADVSGCDFTGANLRAATLTGLIGGGADFSGADLTGTYLIAADLTGARLDDATVEHTVYDQATTWPLGYSPPQRRRGAH